MAEEVAHVTAALLSVESADEGNSVVYVQVLENCFHREFVHEELSANRGLKQACQTLVTWRNELCSRTFSFDLLIFLECFNPDLLSKDRFAISPKFFQRRSIGLLSN